MAREMMNIYCDESCVDDGTTDDFMVIGGIACPTSEKRELVFLIDQLRGRHGVQGEFGWKTVCPSRIAFFSDVLNLFFGDPRLSFRCVVVSTARTTFAGSTDRFEKMYYQVFNNWLDSRGHQYRIFIDRRIDDPTRVSTLRNCLIGTQKFGDSVRFVEEVESRENNLIQLADLLTGAIGYARNNRGSLQGASDAKKGSVRTNRAVASLP